MFIAPTMSRCNACAKLSAMLQSRRSLPRYAMLQICGCFLAWETRSVKIAALNDSRYVGLSVYNVVIACVAGVPVSLILNDRPAIRYVIISLFVIFCTTITLCLVFIPKVSCLVRKVKVDRRYEVNILNVDTKAVMNLVCFDTVYMSQSCRYLL